MSYEPPVFPESRADEESIHERVARARKLREDAAKRVEERYADVKPRKVIWRVGDHRDLHFDRPPIL